jgi:predicted RNA-binding protein with PIN domain
MQFRKTYIDGYNVLRKITRLERLLRSNADAARRGLADFVRSRSRNRGHIVIVFDGHGEAIGGSPNIRVVYSLTSTADAWIRRSLEHERHPRSVLVVSSDNEVRSHAHTCGAATLTAKGFIDDDAVRDRSEDFEQYVKNRRLSDQEIEQWLRDFNQTQAQNNE